MLDFKNKKVAAILSCNEIQKYLDWLPYAAKAWELNGATPVIILVNHTEIPNEIKNENWDIRLLPKMDDKILSSYISQIVREFYAGLLEEYDAVITSDLDTMCLPSKLFFERYINESIEDNKFIAMRYNHPEIFIPWNVAPPNIWREIMGGISTVDHVLNAIESIFEQGGGFENPQNFKHPNTHYTIDQKVLTKQVFEYSMGCDNKYGQINGFFIPQNNNNIDLAHHHQYMSPYINNDRVKIIDKLDLYGIGIDDDGNLREGGSYQWNHKSSKNINIDDINLNKHITIGTGNATSFNKETLDWALKTFWNHD